MTENKKSQSERVFEPLEEASLPVQQEEELSEEEKIALEAILGAARQTEETAALLAHNRAIPATEPHLNVNEVACYEDYLKAAKLSPKHLLAVTSQCFHKCNCLLVAAGIQCKACGFTDDTSFSMSIRHPNSGLLSCTCTNHQTFELDHRGRKIRS